jgi:hypothetical protein
MKRWLTTGLLAGALAAGVAAPGSAQENDFLDVGSEAPDFEITGATRDGVMEEPVRLSEYRGETVVLAFFFRARTRG